MSASVPDAILSPIGYAGPGDAATRLAKLQADFSAILRVSRVYVRHQGASHFVTGDPSDTMLYPQSEPRAGQPRYDWADQGDGLSYGYIKANA